MLGIGIEMQCQWGDGLRRSGGGETDRDRKSQIIRLRPDNHPQAVNRPSNSRQISCALCCDQGRGHRRGHSMDGAISYAKKAH